MDVPRRTALILGVGALVTTSAALASLTEENTRLRTPVEKPTAPALREPGARPLGSFALEVPLGYAPMPVSPAPGVVRSTLAAAVESGRKKVCLLAQGGSYVEPFTVPAGLDVIFQPRSQPALGTSDQVILDGRGVLERHVTASGRLLFRGVKTQGHVPPFGTSDGGNAENSENVAFYFGGTAPGSGFEDSWLTKSAGNVFKSLVDETTVRRCTIEDIGHTPFFLSAADDSLVEDTLIRRYNLGGYPPEPQSAAFKVTGSEDLTVKNVAYEDGNGAHGAWLDDTCWKFTFTHIRWNGAPVDGRKAIKSGITLELCEDGTLVDVAGAGCSSGVAVVDTGHVHIWDSDLRGNYVGAGFRQDKRSNTAGRIETPEDVPMKTLGCTVHNTRFDGSFPIIAFDDSLLFNLLGGQMVTVIEGCDFAGGGPELAAAGGARRAFDNQAALSAVPASHGGDSLRVGSNYFGTDSAAAAKVRVRSPG